MAIIFDKVSKHFQGRMVLERLDWQLDSGSRWLVQGPSGAGKTTLLRLLVGLERVDSGQILGAENVRFSMCFQENRLCGRLNSITNIAMVCPEANPAQLREDLRALLPDEALCRPAETLSGGMARRTALARALLAPSDAVVLDEPFTGLDEESRSRALTFIETHLGGRTLVLVSHELPQFHDAEILQLS